MAEWTSKALGELVQDGAISYGIVQPGADQADGVPIVRVRDLSEGRIDTRDAMRVAPEISARHSRTVLSGGEVLVSIVGTVGEALVVSADLAGWNVARAVAVLRPRAVSAEWLALAFRTDGVRAEISGLLNTTVQATLNLADLKRLQVPMPPQRDREAIVEVLGALDDKISANKKTIELLLGLADAQFVRAVAGSIPGPLTFGELADIGGGGTPRTTVDEYWGGAVHWATPTDVTALGAPYLSGTSRTITDEGLAACSSALYPVGSILMTSRATIGAFAVASVPTAVNQGFIVVNAKNPAHQWWLFHEMKSRVPEFLSFANGATFLELPRGRFKGLNVRLASSDAISEFDSVVGPRHEAAAAFVAESQRLARTRDELLPLLMSGKVRVKDAEKTVEGVL